MAEEYNKNQIIWKDARDCFVESLCDFFEVGKVHLAFATYDVSLPAGQCQTNNIHIFIGVDELQEICRKEIRVSLYRRQWTGGAECPGVDCSAVRRETGEPCVSQYDMELFE